MARRTQKGEVAPSTPAPGPEPTLEPLPAASLPAASLPPTVALAPASLQCRDEPTLPHEEPGAEPSSACGVDTICVGTFAKYELEDKLAVGGMGIVYKARDTVLKRTVALKTIRTGLLAEPEEVQRFYQEARAVAQLRHPHIVSIFDIAEHAGEHYFTMEFAEGGNLARQLDKFFQEPPAAAALVEKIARALHYAHEHGILHRDLKPSNILLDEHGEPRVSDFGLAKFLDAAVDLTEEGRRMGTPSYMAPEQIGGDGKETGRPTDVWALGVLLYELLTGRKPFLSKSKEELTRLIRATEPPSPHQLRPALDRDLSTIVLKCLEKDPTQRYASADALADDLQRWLHGEPISVRPLSWPARTWRKLRRHPVVSAAVLLALVAAVAVTAWTIYQADPERPLRRAQADLRGGRPATLIGDTGGPGWSRAVLGQAELTKKAVAHAPFWLSTNEVCLLELLPDPQVQHYRFRAEMRHELGEDESEVGLYFCHSIHTFAGDAGHCFCKVAFNEVVDLRAKYEDIARKEKITPPRGNPVGLTAWLMTADVRQRRHLVNRPPWVFPAQPLILPWRELMIEVGPQAISVWWDGQRVDTVTQAQLVQAASQQLQDPALKDVQPQFGPRASLGLYLCNGSASFRNVVVEPLDK